MSLLSTESLQNASQDSVGELQEEIKSRFISEVEEHGYFRPHLFVYNDNSMEMEDDIRVLEIGLRDVDSELEEDKQLAIAEALGIMNVMGTSRGIIAYDEIQYDEIDEESTEVVMIIMFNEFGMLIHALPYNKVDDKIDFMNNEFKAIDIGDINKDIITTLAISVGSHRSNEYTADYIHVLEKRGHTVNVVSEQHVESYFPI